MTKKLISIVGPTAVGKTSLAIDVAKKLSCEILSCDSRQFYKELEIGTAKPTLDELNQVKHYFINNLSINDSYTVADFEQEALNRIDELHQKSDYVVMVGGSGLFYKVVVDGFDDIPSIDKSVREKLMNELGQFGIEHLQNELKKLDFEHYQSMDIQNSQRLIRALEVCRGTGKTYTSFRTGKKKDRPFKNIKIGLEMDRELLYQRIDTRMDLMLEQGLLEEVKSLVDYRNHNALQTVGYKEIFDFIDGNYDWDECVRLLKRNSRRYAKRQMTWFKKDTEINWIDINPENTSSSLNQIINLID